MLLRTCSATRSLTWRAILAGVAAVALLGPPGAVQAGHGMEPTPTIQVARAADAQITIDNFVFSPATLTIATGTTVTWTNQDDMVHTVTAANGVFASKGLETGDAYSYTFTATGTYTYYCALHPKMTATIIVR